MKEWLGDGVGGGLLALGFLVIVFSIGIRLQSRKSPDGQDPWTTSGIAAGILLMVLGLFGYFVAFSGGF